MMQLFKKEECGLNLLFYFLICGPYYKNITKHTYCGMRPNLTPTSGVSLAGNYLKHDINICGLRHSLLLGSLFLTSCDIRMS